MDENNKDSIIASFMRISKNCYAGIYYDKYWYSIIISCCVFVNLCELKIFKIYVVQL